MAELQEDERLLIQILVRLPVKSLIRFTCVCKYWLSLIRSPNFVTKHYSTRSNLSEYDSILSVLRPACSISRFNYQDLTFETAFKFRPSVAYDPPRFKIYHRDIITDFNLIGPSNGLFLIDLTKKCQVLLLWNPATRELFKLPQVPNGCCCCFGLGFDPVTHDYKVVGLYGYSDMLFDNTIVWLYSLAANSWKRLFNAYTNLTHFCYYTRVESYLHIGPSSTGRMHNWILRDHLSCSQPRNSLLSFDMVDEVFVETPLPPDAPTIIHGFLYLGSNRMYPSVFCVGHDLQLHVWDLQQYGPTGVWNKVLNLNLKFPAVRGPFYMVLQKNKEFVFSNLDTVSSFNLATQQLKSLGIPADDDILAYTESLVSIASSVRQPPPITMDQSSAETVSLPFVHVDDQQATQIPADNNNLAYTESSVSIARSEFQPSPTINHSSDESVPLQVGDKGDVDDQQATQSIIPDSILRFLKNKECQPTILRIFPEPTNTEGLLSRRRLVRQPQAMDYSSDETVQLEDEGPVEGQQESSETTMIHQMQLPKEDDDSDDSSTDSAFLTPDITPLLDSSTIYIDYEKDAEFYPLRKNEVERLLKLPYCLHEINKPVIYNPYTF